MAAQALSTSIGAAYVYVDDVEALCVEFSAKGIEILRGPESTDYG